MAPTSGVLSILLYFFFPHEKTSVWELITRQDKACRLACSLRASLCRQFFFFFTAIITLFFLLIRYYFRIFIFSFSIFLKREKADHSKTCFYFYDRVSPRLLTTRRVLEFFVASVFARSVVSDLGQKYIGYISSIFSSVKW